MESILFAKMLDKVNYGRGPAFSQTQLLIHPQSKSTPPVLYASASTPQKNNPQHSFQNHNHQPPLHRSFFKPQPNAMPPIIPFTGHIRACEGRLVAGTLLTEIHGWPHVLTAWVIGYSWIVYRNSILVLYRWYCRAEHYRVANSCLRQKNIYTYILYIYIIYACIICLINVGFLFGYKAS